MIIKPEICVYTITEVCIIFSVDLLHAFKQSANNSIVLSL